MVALSFINADAQDVSYQNHTLDFPAKPVYPQYASYTSFDMAAVTTMDESQVNMNLPYQVKLGSLKQVPCRRTFMYCPC